MKTWFPVIMGVMGARCVFAAATLVNNSWQKVGSDYNGSILDAAHWNKGYVPTALERFYFGSLSADFQVDFPGGTYTNPANFRLMGQDGYAVTVDGANTKWVMPGSADGTELSDSDPWRIYATSSYSLFNLSIGGATLYSHAISELENFRFTLNGSESNPKLVFDGGTYNFRDPAGSAWETETKPLLLLGQGHATASSEIVFKNGASLRAWDIGVQASAPVNTVLFDGGNHYIEKIQFPDGSTDYYNALATRSDTVLTNGATLSAASVNFGHRANKDVRLWLFGQDTELISRGEFKACSVAGTSYLTVMDGATVRFQGKTTLVSGGGGTNFTTLVGGQLVFEGSESSLCAVNDAVACDRSLVLFNTTNGMVSCPVAAFDIDGMADVRSTGTAWSLNALRMGNKNNGGTPRFEVLGGTVTATNDNVIGVSDNAELVVNGGTFRALRYFNVGQNAGATGIVTVASGMFDNCYLAAETPTGISTVFYLGKSQKNSYGILNVTGGEMRLLSLYAGWIGHGEINVSGGKLYLRSDLRLAARSVDNADSVEDVFTVSGGEVECGFSGAAKIGFYSPNHARLKLDGGTFTCSGLQGGNAATAAGGAGWVALEADGGTIAARANNTEFLSKFDEAVINAGGLTIDTRGYAVTIKQNLTGTGMLTLAGGGSVTFDSGVTCGVKVRVVGGTTVDFGGVSPAGLVLGDGTTAGKIKLTLDSTVAVNGDLVINNIGFDLSGSLVKDTDYAPFITCTGTFDAASKEKWEDAMLSDVISPTETTVFAWTTDAGVTQLTIKSIDKVVHLIEVKEGTSNITDSVVSRTTENVEVAVSNAAVCNISGKVAKGRLIKTGTGKLELSSGDNIFLGGFDLVNGVLTLGAAGAFGDGTATQASVFRAGTFEVSAAAGPMTLANASTLAPDPATNGIIFKTEGDLTMPIPLASSAGAIIKRGAGRLVFTCDWDNSKTIGWSRGHVPAATLYNFPRYQTSIGFDAANGAIPEGAMYGTIVVVEGELVFRGTGSATRIDCSSSPVFVGYPTADHTSDFAQPTLVLDNVYGNFGGGSTDFRVGDCFTTANPWVTEPKILVTNNATLYVNTLYLTGTWADNTAAAAKLIVDGATVSAYYRFNPHNSSFTGVTPKGYFSNGAKLLTPFVELHKNCEMYFTNSVMAAEYTSGTYAFSTMSHYEDQPSRWTFVAGSTLYLNSITRKSSNTGSTATELRFDDAEWIPATGDYDFNADLKVSETLVDPAVKIVSLGTGLVLAPPADATWTMCKLEGEGGFVKRGEGTVTFNGTNAQFLGVTKVASGTLDLDASVWTNAKICGGAGMIANGTLSQPTIALCVSEAAGAWSADGVPHFGSTCSLNGRTKVDVGGVAIPIGKSLIVANYSGSAPDVSAWKLIGVPDSGGAFTAMGGQITMTVVDTAGFILLVK